MLMDNETDLRNDYRMIGETEKLDIAVYKYTDKTLMKHPDIKKWTSFFLYLQCFMFVMALLYYNIDAM